MAVDLEPHVALWRIEQLFKAGFTVPEAEDLAGSDWHQAVQMLDAGCPPELVLAILK